MIRLNRIRDRRQSSAAARAIASRIGQNHVRRLRGWEPFAHLNASSLALTGFHVDSPTKAVNLVVPSISADQIFAGVRTAIVFAAGLAERLRLPLRVVVLAHSTAKPRDSGAVSEIAGLPVTIVSAWQSGWSASRDDLWVATYWTTAHALYVAERAGLINLRQAIYLVQDYEPSFFPASTESSLSRATYGHGFTTVVNSVPLSKYLDSQGVAKFDEALVFAPELDRSSLQKVSASRVHADVIRIGFYGRPSKPRNAFGLGVAAIKLAASEFGRRGIDVQMYSMGEPHSPISTELGDVASLGRLSWPAYYDQLGETDIVFALQQTPHPSHLPLDAVLSGARAVTNEVGESRARLHPRWAASDDSPEKLAAALVATAMAARHEGPAVYDEEFLEQLGRPLNTVLDRLSKGL